MKNSFADRYEENCYFYLNSLCFYGKKVWKRRENNFDFISLRVILSFLLAYKHAEKEVVEKQVFYRFVFLLCDKKLEFSKLNSISLLKEPDMLRIQSIFTWKKLHKTTKDNKVSLVNNQVIIQFLFCSTQTHSSDVVNKCYMHIKQIFM